MSTCNENIATARAAVQEQLSAELGRIAAHDPAAAEKIMAAQQAALAAAQQAAEAIEESNAKVAAARAHVLGFAKLRHRVDRVQSLNLNTEDTSAVGRAAIEAYLTNQDSPSTEHASRFQAVLSKLHTSAILAPHVARYVADLESQSESRRAAIISFAEESKIDLRVIVGQLQREWSEAPANFGEGFDPNLLYAILK